MLPHAAHASARIPAPQMAASRPTAAIYRLRSSERLQWGDRCDSNAPTTGWKLARNRLQGYKQTGGGAGSTGRGRFTLAQRRAPATNAGRPGRGRSTRASATTSSSTASTSRWPPERPSSSSARAEAARAPSSARSTSWSRSRAGGSSSREGDHQARGQGRPGPAADRHRLPAVQPLPAPARDGQPDPRGAPREEDPAARPRSVHASCSPAWASREKRERIRTSCPAASSSGSRSPGRWSWSRT